MTSTIRRPEGRYDEPHRLPRPLGYALAGLLGVLVLLGTFLAWERSSAHRTSASVLSYRVVDDHSVEIRFDVAKSVDSTVVCALRAVASDGAEVGKKDVTVGPGPRVVTAVVTTSRRTAVGQVTGCSA
jgi:hypothetical protein